MENNKADNYQETPKGRPVVDKSRRSFAKAGIVAPVIMSLSSKTALGSVPYHCTISGQLSGNTSSHHDAGTPCPTGTSGASWSGNCHNSTANGGTNDWAKTGVCPYWIQVNPTSSKKQYCLTSNTKPAPQSSAWINDTTPTGTYHPPVSTAFGGPSQNATLCTQLGFLNSTQTCYEVLVDTTQNTAPYSLLYCAVVNYLNLAGSTPKQVIPECTAADIVTLYNFAAGYTTSSCKTSGGSIITNPAVAGSFLKAICSG